MLIVTTNDVPGQVVGGELKGMTKALIDSRQQVIDRMVAEAEVKGANAILAMRFDTSEMGGIWTEICAYGTAEEPPVIVRNYAETVAFTTKDGSTIRELLGIPTAPVRNQSLAEATLAPGTPCAPTRAAR